MIKKNIWLILVSLFVISLGVFANSNFEKNYTDIDSKDAYNLINETPEIIIVDVSSLYEMVHIPKAINAPVTDGTLDKELLNWDKDKVYLVYCHNDETSILGAQKLIDAGFTKVFRLKGNYSAWVEAKLPI